MSVPRPAVERLYSGMRADVAAYGELKRLLGEQFEAALRHDADGMGAVTRQIEELAATLEARRRERVALAATLLAASAKPVTIASIARQLPAAQRARFDACWSLLEQKLNECKSLNARNRRLMTDQNDVMRRVLGAEADTYDPR